MTNKTDKKTKRKYTKRKGSTIKVKAKTQESVVDLGNQVVNGLKQELDMYEFKKVSKDQQERMESIKKAGQVMVKKIFKNVKCSHLRTVALNDLHKAVMQCRLAISHE